MNKRLILGVGLWLVTVTIGQGRHGNAFEQIDQHARSAPRRVATDVYQLTAYLVKPATSDLEKVRSFYVWIAENIAYDVRAFRRYTPGQYQKTAPDEVLKKRKAVCQGYAELFQAMCQLQDIPCYVVPGYSKGVGRQNNDFTRGDHAWNAVRIDGQWQLLDVTWGSGGLDDQLKFVRQFNEKYFLTSPAVFLADHLPLDPLWQLTQCTVSTQSFAQGEEAVRQALAARCNTPEVSVSDYEQLSAEEKILFSARRAYQFNPANPLVLVRAYMNRAHALMSSIPRQLYDREAMRAALRTQQEALDYLEQAQKVAARGKGDEAKQLRKLIGENVSNSQNNLKSLQEALNQ